MDIYVSFGARNGEIRLESLLVMPLSGACEVVCAIKDTVVWLIVEFRIGCGFQGFIILLGRIVSWNFFNVPEPGQWQAGKACPEKAKPDVGGSLINCWDGFNHSWKINLLEREATM
ncbi:hypothetical protein JTE90_029348 [Oedothorax gibbosus]|uniref:Uncharacterized protein n=1 Tax=Oedothorax gibbosus TaxID=931172 RepID=A0AAV6UF39_9ARAC|nr:hypothetical protein JTE90_029348 [Oedothorax gibbosus]